MGLKPLGIRERHRGGADAAASAVWRSHLHKRGALHEIKHRQAGRKARRAGRGQHVVGAGHIIPHRLRACSGPGRWRRRGGSSSARGVGVCDGKLQMFRGQIRSTSGTDVSQAFGTVMMAPKSCQLAVAVSMAARARIASWDFRRPWHDFDRRRLHHL